MGKGDHIVPNHIKLLSPSLKALSKLETAPLTLVPGPQSMELCSGEVKGRVFIVGHM